MVVSCYGEAINVRSRQYRNYARLIRDEHVGGMIVLGHVQYGSVHNAEPYAMAALLNRLQRLAKVPLLVGGGFRARRFHARELHHPWPYNMAFAAAHDVERQPCRRRRYGAGGAGDRRELDLCARRRRQQQSRQSRSSISARTARTRRMSRLTCRLTSKARIPIRRIRCW